MSFREKSAWVMAALMCFSGATYLWLVITISRALGETAPPMAAVIPYVLMVVVGAILVQIVLALLTPREADAPADEREKQIQLRADAWSGVVLGLGVVTSLGAYVFQANGPLLFHMVATSLIAAQIAEYAIVIVLFRRGV